MKIVETVPNGIFVKYSRDLSYHFNRGEVLFIESIRYFLNNPNIGVIREGRKWIYNSFENLADHMNYSKRHLIRIVASLVEKGVLFVGNFSGGVYNRTNYYSLNEEKIKEILGISGDDGDDCERHNVIILGDKMSLTISTENTNIDLINKSEREITSQTSQHIKKDISEPNTEPDRLTETTQKPKIPPTTVQDMFKIWKERFPNKSDRLDRSLARMMVASFKAKFNCNLEEWRHYLRQIESSAYLTGTTFNLTLSWALKFKTIDRIRNKDLGVKDVPRILTAEEVDFSIAEAIKDIEATSDTPKVKSVRRAALQKYGVASYKSWFEKLEMFETENGVSYKTPNKFIHDYVRDNLWHKLPDVNLEDNIWYKLSA